MNIGEKIKALRKSQNKSQEELAFDVGVSRQTINKWETNKVQPNTENLKILCAIFGVSADTFLESEVVCNDEQNVVTAVATAKSNVKRKILIICSVVDGLLFLISAIWTILSGFTVFTPNTGREIIASVNIEFVGFIVLLIFTVLFFIAEIILLISIYKNRQKTTRSDTNVNTKYLKDYMK